MGIDIHAAQFMHSEVRRGLRLGNTLTLGHQSLYLDQSQYQALVKTLGIAYRDTPYADDLFRAWGATNLDVMDASNYEGANVLHDLNEPVRPELLETYDCVFDGGALEHVFNFPLALKNCMEMVKVGGRFITITPAAAYCGHGFYQFSPELFYAALSEENGYIIDRMLFIHRNQWYSIRKPAEIRQRVELFTQEPTLVFVATRRIEKKPVFSRWPQQSDYVVSWGGNIKAAEISPKKSAKAALVGLVPFARKLQTRWRNYKSRRQCLPSNRTRFVPVNLD